MMHIIKENTHHAYAFIYKEGNVQGDISLSFFLERHASVRIEFFVVNINASITINCTLHDESSHAIIKGACMINQEHAVHIKTIQHHTAAHATSDVVVKSVLYDQANFSYTGMIRVEQEAHDAVASQENKNIVLSSKARAVSVPQLEVLTNNVRCFHGSAIGTFDQEQLWYAASRGIALPCAEKLFLKGFFSGMFENKELKQLLEE